MSRHTRTAKKSEPIAEVDSQPRHYVAVGASAGGLEAIEAFFTHMPDQSGLAFIVVQHLSPDYKSLMVELLSKKTPMSVCRAEDGVIVQANTIYLIPPKKNLKIHHGKLLLSDQDQSRGINLPIDIFMRSLAEDQGEKAIGIILSGTGSDGTRGVRAIKESGGMVMVQDEQSAKFDGMPKAAQSTGLADFVLKPEEMPERLLAFIQHPCVSAPMHTQVILSDEDRMAHLFAIVRDQCGIDFAYYKQNTVGRRIERRMTIHHVEDLQGYLEVLGQSRTEVHALYKEMLIGVTSFFRDPEVWKHLGAGALRDLLREANGQQVRFWVPACSTGEEAYSLAILVRECLDDLGVARDVKIFATDIDQDAIQYAAAGCYPESIAADISPKHLAKFFFKRDDNFQISRTIREMVVFARHNLIKDPPFTRIALISCRNVLIYLQPILQRKVLESFAFSLPPGGVLLLGTSESCGELSEHWEVLDSKAKLFRARQHRHIRPGESSLQIATDTRSRDLRGQYSALRRVHRQTEEERILDRLLESLSFDYLPLALIVNSQMELLHVVGNTQGLIRVPPGKPTHDVTRMACKELSIPMATGIQKVFKEGKPIKFSNIRILSDGASRVFELQIRLLPQRSSQEPLTAILINEALSDNTSSAGAGAATYDVSREAEERIQDLEQELQFTRENLQATIEELETSNEELQATNEELLASNEELQSTNEELQSTNEELFTVNTEFQSRIIELTTLHNDVENLLSASHVGTVLLDENYEIRRFSKIASEAFHLSERDIGRNFLSIPRTIPGFDREEFLESTMRQAGRDEREICTLDGRWFLLRASPYMVGPETPSGLVLTLLDISQIRAKEHALVTSDGRLRTLYANIAQGVVYQAGDGRITSANPAAERILGLSLDQMTGRTSLDPRWRAIRGDGSVLPGDQHPAMIALQTGKPISNELMGVYKPDKTDPTWISVSAVPLGPLKDDSADSVFTSFEDITALVEAQRALTRSQALYRQMFERLDVGFALHEGIFDADGEMVDYRFLELNPAFEKITGLVVADVLGRRALEVLPKLESEWLKRFGAVATTGHPDRFIHTSRELGRGFDVQAFCPMPSHFAVLFQACDSADPSAMS